MRAAPLPADEAQRLASLHALDVLDTAPEQEFDALVAIASRICAAPVSLISLIDAQRQWFKANLGLPGTTETPRDIAFCAHAILGDELLTVPDATADPRFGDNPLVTGDPRIRFYAGAPLVMRDGSRVGTLCVIDREPRTLSAEQAQALRQLALVASRALEARQVQRALVTERERLANIIEGTQVGTWEWNLQTGQTRFNQRWAQIIGHTLAELEPVSIDTWQQRLHPEDAKRSRTLLSQHQVGHDGACECEVRMRHRDGSWVWVLDRGKVMTHTPDGKPEWMFGIRMDITERKRQEEALRRNEDFLDRTGRVAGVGGWELDVKSRRVTWSDETRRIHGVAPDHVPTLEEAIGFYAPQARPVIEAAVERGMRDGRGWDLELPFVRADGHAIWVRAVGAAEFEHGAVVRLVGAFQDITDRVLASHRLEQSRAELRRLSASLTRSREAERRHLARELHDELGQRLAGLKMDLSALPEGPRMASLLAAVDEAIAATRRIAADLRPAMLDDLGLDAAIEWLAKTWGQRTGIAITIDGDAVAPTLSDDATLTVYRIVQEALTNVSRHAQATRAHITLRREANDVVITVDDNGRGLSPGDLDKPGSSGLVGIRERALLHGGAASVANRPEGGCRIQVRLPLDRVDSSDDELSRSG